MKHSSRLWLFLSVLILPQCLIGQAVVQNDTVYYPEVHAVTYDQVVYKTAVQIDEWTPPILENLSLRVYYPTDLAPDDKRPLVVLIHGGGFIGGSYASFFDEAEALAQLGYIAASIQYRLCKRGDCVLAAGTSIPCNVSWNNSLVPSAYTAAVDVADAIEWLQLHASGYQIDVDNIAVGGHSAGAWTALHLAFMDQEEIIEICPGCGTWPDYLEEELTTPTGIKAVINMSGAILDTLWIDPEEAAIDLMTIHGTHDGVVHYGSEPVYPCCNTYTVPVQGACPITSRQRQLGGSNYLLTGQNFGHDVFTADWWPESELQILWFLGKSFFDAAPFDLHTEQIRNSPVETCPPPFTPVVPAGICSIPLVASQVVLFDEVINKVRSALPVGFYCFPNPTGDLLTVEFGTGSLPGQVELYDAGGRMLLSVPVRTGKLQIDLSSYPNGLYLLRAGGTTQKIVRMSDR